MNTWLPILAAGMLAAAADGQTTTAPAIPTSEYTNVNFGFSLQTPAGWAYDRTGFFGPPDALGVLRGAAGGGKATLQVLVFQRPDTPPGEIAPGRWKSFDHWLLWFCHELGELSDTRRVESAPRQHGEHAGATIEADARIGGKDVTTFYEAVQFDKDVIWLFSLAAEISSSAERTGLRNLFDQLVGTLEIRYDPQQAIDLRPALERGRDVIARLRNVASRLPIDDETGWFEIRIDGKPVGYFTRQARRAARKLSDPRESAGGEPLSGLEIEEVALRFAPDNSATFRSLSLFCSFDLKAEQIRSTQMEIPSPVTPVEPFSTRDEVLRVGDTLFSSFSTSRDRGLPPPRAPLTCGESYLSLAWVRWLPALLGTRPGALHAFTIYDVESRTLLTYAIQSRGPVDELSDDGVMAAASQPAGEPRAFLFEVREGFQSEPVQLFTDEKGAWLRLVAGDTEVRRSTRREIDRQFGQQRERVLQRVEALQQKPR